MTPRKGETREEFNARHAATRPSRGKWQTTQRTLGPEGDVRSKTQRREPTLVPVDVPEGLVKFATTIYDSEGRAARQFVRVEPKHQDAAAIARVMLDEMAKPLPQRPLVFELGGGPRVDHLMTVIPIGDPHVGMLSWRPETGASWDLEIAESTIVDAFARLLPTTPKCSRGVVISLGDFGHYDSTEPLTPKHKHLLDADSRWQKMVRVGIRIFIRVIELAAAWYGHLEVIALPGNHDPFLSTIISEALAVMYADNPRITINTSASPYRFVRFGKVLIGATHGDLCKPAMLPGVMSADVAHDWGETLYRYWYTGHVHSRHAEDFQGCSWESFRTLTPPDAHLHRSAYRSRRDLTAIVHHRAYGEVARHIVNPAMLEKP